MNLSNDMPLYVPTLYSNIFCFLLVIIMNSCTVKDKTQSLIQMLTNCCELTCMIPHSIFGIEHCYRMSHSERSNPHQHGSHYPRHSLECAGINPPAPPLWQRTHTHSHKTASTAVWIFIPRSVFPIRMAMPLSLLHHTVLTGEMELWVQLPHRQFPTIPALLLH